MTSPHLFQKVSFRDIREILQSQDYWLHELQPQHIFSLKKRVSRQNNIDSSFEEVQLYLLKIDPLQTMSQSYKRN
jgi:hypothetical protein